MRKLTFGATDEQMKDVVREWVDLVVQQRFEDAHALFYRPPDSHVTVETMKTLIENHVFIELLETVTSTR